MVEPFLFLPVASSLHDEDALRRMLSGFELPLLGIGGEPVGELDLERPAPLMFLVLTGGTERRILDLLDRRHAAVPDEPLVLIAHPRHNSLPAAMEALARVHQLHGRGRILVLRGPDDESGLAAIGRAAADLGVWAGLHRTRIGLVGGPSDWLVASSPEPETVRRVWGPEVVPVEMDEVERRYRATAARSPEPFGSSMRTGAATLV
jgi:L-fucose isomerase-like protein